MKYRVFSHHLRLREPRIGYRSFDEMRYVGQVNMYLHIFYMHKNVFEGHLGVNY